MLILLTLSYIFIFQACSALKYTDKDFQKGFYGPGKETVGSRPNSTSNCGCGTSMMGFPAGRMGYAPAAAGRIVGGQAVKPRYALPFMAQLVINWDDRTEEIFCGGSLINSKYVLTAAHCVYDKTRFKPYPRRITVYLGLHNKYNSMAAKNENHKQVIPACSPRYKGCVKIPSNYTQKPLDDDIAIVKLSKKANMDAFVAPICLNPHCSSASGPPIGEAALIAGWGQNGGDSPELNYGGVDIEPFNKKTCSSHSCSITEGKQLCAHSLSTNICTGDAGGPLYLMNNGRYTLVGVASANAGCYNFQKASIYTDICRYMNFILAFSSDGWCANSCKDC